jgi:ankyrin repeat protein
MKAKDENGDTALTLANRKGDLTATKMLVDHEANVNTRGFVSSKMTERKEGLSLPPNAI